MAACWGREADNPEEKAGGAFFASLSQGQREVSNMKAELQRVGMPPDLSHDSGAEDAYLEDLLALHAAWRLYWQAWLRHYAAGKAPLRQPETALLQALHGPEGRIPPKHRERWHALQRSCHEVLHLLQSGQSSKNRRPQGSSQAIETALQLEQRCFDEIIAQSKSLGEIDVLTGLPNRRRMGQELLREQALVERGGRAFLAMMDIDHFKRLNDTYGHSLGDQVLREIARVLRATLRPYDGFYRYGGEEFVAIFPGLLPENALPAGQRICQAVATHLFATQDGLAMTLSVGMAPLLAGKDPQERLAAADAALYAAKREGRNRVKASLA
jgi:diguanylate cyclase (GGDEF)-like protein